MGRTNARKKAIEAGEPFYFSGQPCVRGELARRLTRNGQCQCEGCKARQYAATRAWIGRNEERHRSNLKKGSAEHYRRNVSAIREAVARLQSTPAYRAVRRARHAERMHDPQYVTLRRLAAKLCYCRKASEPEFLLARAMRQMLHRVLSGGVSPRSGRTSDVLGYGVEELRRHLESRFCDGMTWANYGAEWHIDHIASIAELLACGVRSARVINALTNLQPRFAADNLANGRRFELGVSIHG